TPGFPRVRCRDRTLSVAKSRASRFHPPPARLGRRPCSRWHPPYICQFLAIPSNLPPFAASSRHVPSLPLARPHVDALRGGSSPNPPTGAALRPNPPRQAL